MTEPFVTSNRLVLCGNIACQNPVCEVHDATFRAGIARFLLAQNPAEEQAALMAHLRASLTKCSDGRRARSRRAN